MSTIIARDHLILALDVPSSAEAERLLDRVQDQIVFVKVGLELYTAAGPEMVQRLIAQGKRVFLDLKFLDIEETVRRATARVAAMGVEFLTVHANRKALVAAVQGRGESGLKLLAVTVLTNFDSQDLREMGIQRSVQDLVTARALLASEVGCDGVVASGEEPAILRPKVGPRFLIVTPGVRPPANMSMIMPERPRRPRRFRRGLTTWWSADPSEMLRILPPLPLQFLPKCRQPSMPGGDTYRQSSCRSFFFLC